MKLLARLLGRQPASISKKVAKERLQVVLVYDRARIEPGLLDQIRDEIIRSISRHIEVDQSDVALSVAHDSGQSWLVAEIPLKQTTSSPGG